jgi:hypothetical protein
VTKSERLSNKSADRKPKKIHLRKAEGIHKIRCMARHGINRVGCLATRTRDAGIVEQDHWTILRESVSDRAVPLLFMQHFRGGCPRHLYF